MKLSKVTYRVKDKNAKYKKEYNVRAAVANNSENAGGVLYHVPGVDLIDLREQMLDRDRSVRLLYNIFNHIQTGTKPKKWGNDETLSVDENERKAKEQNIKIMNYKWREACSEYIEKSQSTINSVLFYSYEESGYKTKRMNDNEAIIVKMQYENRLSHFTGGKLEDFVAYTLRNSLVVSRYDNQEFDSVNAMVVFINNIGNGNISDKDKKTICKLADLIRNDFSKLNPNVQSSQGANMVRSVRNQNMVVQPQGDKVSFPLVSDEGKNTVTNKNVEKKGLNEFLLNYANLDDEERMEKLRKLRRIIDVYFSSPSHYQKDIFSTFFISSVLNCNTCKSPPFKSSFLIDVLPRDFS